jgi:hypothetical protein
MAIVNLDFNLEDVSSTIEPVPEDNYVCEIEKAELTTASTGKPMLSFTWRITEGEYVGKKLYDNVVLSVDWKVKQYCELANIESGKQLNTDDFNGIEALLNVTVGENPKTGKPNNNIKSMEAIG